MKKLDKLSGKRTACPDCGSDDGLAISPTHTKCFACNKTKFIDTKRVQTLERKESKMVQDTKTNIADISSYPVDHLRDRHIYDSVLTHFGVRVEFDSARKVSAHWYPYTDNGEIVAYKKRLLPKQFSIHGDFGNVALFGQSTFTSSKKLVITEGEIDCLSVAQASFKTNGKIWPVVSLPSANQLAPLLAQRDWVRSFDEVILWFDNDDAGQKAVQQAAKIIGYDKVKIVKVAGKDANEMLVKDGPAAVNQALWNAQAYSPAGIVMGEGIWKQFIDRKETESVPYPECIGGLNTKLKGMRQGEITLFTSGTGSGKSTVIKEIALDLLNKTTSKIGLISLEESVGDTAQKFIGMALNKSLTGELALTEDELRVGYEKVFKDERIILLDHQGSVSDHSLMDKIEMMALMGCKYLILDHITIAVSEGTDGLEGNAAVDKMMSDLLKITKKHNIWLGLISHLRKAGGGGKNFEEGKLASIDDIKGSGSIKQISFDIIAFARNLTATNDIERNQIEFMVLKSRFTGFTGYAGKATYNADTGRLHAMHGFEVEAKEDKGFSI